MDDADRAQGVIEAWLGRALARVPPSAPALVGPLACSDCGEPIPERRRHAAPSATRCIGCQEEHEFCSRETPP